MADGGWTVWDLELDPANDPWLAEQLAASPPLTPERCQRLVDILSSGHVDEAAEGQGVEDEAS